MLAKNRTSALFLTVIFFSGNAIGYLVLSYPLFFAPAPPSAALIVSGILAVVLAVSFSRSGLVMGLDERVGFGWRGALRWLACGGVAGLLLAILNLKLLPLINQKSLFHPLVEIVGYVGIVYLSYWVAFQRSVFLMVRSDPADSPDSGFFSWFLKIGGLIVAAACIFIVYYNLGRDVALVWMGLGGICCGFSAAWIGILAGEKMNASFFWRYSWGILVLGGLAMALMLVGMLL
jgi:hypothetical protein